MKHLKFLSLFALSVSMLFFVFSCNSGEEKKADEPAADSTIAAKTTEPVIANAKRGNVLIIQHKVGSFAKWK